MKEKEIVVAEKKEFKTLEKVKFLFPELQDISDEEIIKAITLAKYYNLDPLKKEVYFVPFTIYEEIQGGKRIVKRKTIQLVTSYLEYIKRAEKSKKLDGWDIEIKEENGVKVAVVTIYRKDWSKPFSWQVYLPEVIKNTKSWREMPLFMLKKVAIAQAFRIAFPEETQELPYEEAEIVSVEVIEEEKEEKEIEEIKKENKEEKEEKEEKREQIEKEAEDD